MRSKIATTTVVRFRFSTSFKGLMLGSLAFGAVGMLPVSVRAQTEAEQMSNCSNWADRQIAEGRMTEEERKQVVEACLVAYMTCGLKMMPWVGSQDQGRERVERCVREIENGAEKYASPRKSSSVDDGSAARCNALLAFRKPDDGIKQCTIAIGSAGISRHEKAVAYAARAIAEITKDKGDRFKTHPELFDQALTDSTKAVLLDPRVGEAYYARGLAYFVKLNPRAAIPNFDIALQVELPDWLRPYVYYARGIERHLLAAGTSDRNMYALAISDETEAIRLQPSADFYRERASAEDFLGQTEAAQADRAAADRLAAESH